MNPKVDFYFSKEGKWQEAIKLMRKIALDCQVEETLKWGTPCYIHNNHNIVLIHVFKDYCAYLFFKGALLKDPKNILIQQTENVQSARQIRFTNIAEIKKLEKTKINMKIVCLAFIVVFFSCNNSIKKFDLSRKLFLISGIL